MKEIIRYVGGGFLAVIIGAGFLRILVEVVPLWEIEEGLYYPESQLEQEYDHVYTEVMKKDDITVKFTSTECIMGNEFVDLQSRFIAYDGNGQKITVNIVSVIGENAGERPKRENGKYCFLSGGIYKVYLRCRNLGFVVRIPVNVLEDVG